MKKRRIPFGTLILTFLPILCVLIASGWYWYSTMYPTPPGSSCGSVVQRLGGFLDAQEASEAEGCFVQAFQGCQALTLTYAESGTDTVASYQFWPAPGGGLCHVRGKLTNDVNGSIFIRYLTCTDLQRRIDGLLISECGANTNNILIPG